jgi:hypothetical protein
LFGANQAAQAAAEEAHAALEELNATFPTHQYQHKLALTTDQGSTSSYAGGWWCDQCQLLRLPTTARLHCRDCTVDDPSHSGWVRCTFWNRSLHSRNAIGIHTVARVKARPCV